MKDVHFVNSFFVRYLSIALFLLIGLVMWSAFGNAECIFLGVMTAAFLTILTNGLQEEFIKALDKDMNKNNK